MAKKTVFKGVINGIEFDNVKEYNKYHSNIDTAYSPRKADFWHEMKKNLNIYE